jgi:hypothetical protein
MREVPEKQTMKVIKSNWESSNMKAVKVRSTKKRKFLSKTQIKTLRRRSSGTLQPTRMRK